MLNKLAQIFTKKPSAEQVFMEQNRIEFNDEQGFMINGFVLNDLSERLEYFSNRKLKKFDDLKEQLFSEIRENTRNDEPDAMYIESNIGTFSMADVYPMKHIGDDKKPLRFLQFKQKEIKERLSCAAID